MAEATAQKEDPHVANLKFREKELAAKVDRLKGMSDKAFDPYNQGLVRKEALDRAELQLEQIRKELKKPAK